MSIIRSEEGLTSYFEMGGPNSGPITQDDVTEINANYLTTDSQFSYDSGEMYYGGDLTSGGCQFKFADNIYANDSWTEFFVTFMPSQSGHTDYLSVNIGKSLYVNMTQADDGLTINVANYGGNMRSATYINYLKNMKLRIGILNIGGNIRIYTSSDESNNYSDFYQNLFNTYGYYQYDGMPNYGTLYLRNAKISSFKYVGAIQSTLGYNSISSEPVVRPVDYSQVFRKKHLELKLDIESKSKLTNDSSVVYSPKTYGIFTNSAVQGELNSELNAGDITEIDIYRATNTIDYNTTYSIAGYDSSNKVIDLVPSSVDQSGDFANGDYIIITSDTVNSQGAKIVSDPTVTDNGDGTYTTHLAISGFDIAEPSDFTKNWKVIKVGSVSNTISDYRYGTLDHENITLSQLANSPDSYVGSIAYNDGTTLHTVLYMEHQTIKDLNNARVPFFKSFLIIQLDDMLSGNGGTTYDDRELCYFSINGISLNAFSIVTRIYPGLIFKRNTTEFYNYFTLHPSADTAVFMPYTIDDSFPAVDYNNLVYRLVNLVLITGYREPSSTYTNSEYSIEVEIPGNDPEVIYKTIWDTETDPNNPVVNRTITDKYTSNNVTYTFRINFDIEYAGTTDRYFKPSFHYNIKPIVYIDTKVVPPGV